MLYIPLVWKKNFSIWYNINWGDVQRKYVVDNVDMSNLRAQWKNGPHKTNTYNGGKHTEQQDVTDIQNKLYIL